MEIIDVYNNNYKIRISNDVEATLIEFDPFKKELNFILSNNLNV
ncbi:hypothetical protein [Clostridium muellerianum]|nr:hypothetical protein [Clostridium muellerianum]